MASKAFVVLRISYSATPGESTLRKGFCRVAKYGETRLVPGPRSEVSSMAGEVVTGYHSRHAPVGIFRWLTTTNHHEIGILYLANSFVFFLIGGVLALLMRTELAYPGRTIVDASPYMELFTMHGTTMIFLVAIPILAGFGNLMLPPLIGAKDMAFPRINALSFWLIPTAGVIMWLGAANIGWTGYTPLSVYDKSFGVHMWIVGLQLLGISSTAGAVNFLVTIFRHRAPGITFTNLSLFVWSITVTQGLVLRARPVLAGGLFLLVPDRPGMTAFRSPPVHEHHPRDRGAERDQDLQLDRDHVGRRDRAEGAHALRDRLRHDVRDRRHQRRLPGADPARLSPPGHVLGRRPSALRPLRRDDPRRLRGLLLLVPAAVETDVQGTPGPVALRPHGHRPDL